MYILLLKHNCATTICIETNQVNNLTATEYLTLNLQMHSEPIVFFLLFHFNNYNTMSHGFYLIDKCVNNYQSYNLC